MLRQTWRKKSSRTRKRKRNKEIGPTERLPRFRIFVFLLDKSKKSWYTVDTAKMRYFHGDGSERRCFKKHFLTLLHNILHSASGDSNTVCRAENRRRQNRLFSAFYSNSYFCDRIAADRPFFLLFFAFVRQECPRSEIFPFRAWYLLFRFFRGSGIREIQSSRFRKKEQKKYRSAGIDPFSLRARSPNRTAIRSIRMPICSFLFGSRAKKRFIHAFFLLSMLLSTRTR